MTSAPSLVMASRRAVAMSPGTKIFAPRSNSRATRATARPWLPSVAARSEIGRRASKRSLSSPISFQSPKPSSPRSCSNVTRSTRVGAGSHLLRPVYAVFEAVHQSLPGGFDDVLGDADGAPHPFAVCRVYEDAGRCRRGAVLVEDANLVVGEVDLFQLRIVRPDSFPQRLVQGVYRTITLRCGDDPLPAYGKLYGRLRRRLPVGALLGDYPERLQLEERLVLSRRPPYQ